MDQQKQRKLLCDRQKHAVKLMDELGLFDLDCQKHDGPILPVEWKGWGTRNNTFVSQITQPSKILFTGVLGVAAIAVVWLS